MGDKILKEYYRKKKKFNFFSIRYFLIKRDIYNFNFQKRNTCIFFEFINISYSYRKHRYRIGYNEIYNVGIL